MKRILRFRLVFVLIACVLMGGQGWAQKTSNIVIPVDTSALYTVRLKDRTVIHGKVVSEEKDTLTLSTTTMGKVKVSVTHIKNIQKEELAEGRFSFPNPNVNRYLFCPSAFPVGPGEGYYQNNFLDLNSCDIGITNDFSIGAGLEMLATITFLSQGNFQPLYYVMPKVGFKLTDKLHGGGGMLYASLPGLLFSKNYFHRVGIGALYCMGTYGTTENNITVCSGWAFVNKKLTQRPIVIVSGMTRLANHYGLVSENWVVPTTNSEYIHNPAIPGTYTKKITHSYYPVFSYGIRFLGKKMSFDLALINNKDIAKAIVFGIPYFDFVAKF